MRKSRSFCAERINLKPIDSFVIIAVIMALAYIVFNRAYTAVNETKRTNIVIAPQGGGLFGKDTVDVLVQEFEQLNPELRIREATETAPADIVFFDDSAYGSLENMLAIVPLVSFMDVFIYNIDLLKAAGLDRPPKTRAEFLTAARAVAEKGAASAFALGLSPEDPLALRRDFYPWIWANGVDINDIDLEDNPALPRAVMDVVALFGQLNREKLLAPGTFAATGAQRLQEFAEGKIAMMTISARDLAFIHHHAPGITVGITALPAMAQGKNRLGLSSIYAGISGDGGAPDEAQILLSFLVEKSAALAEAVGAVPGNYPGGFAGEYIEKSELLAKAWDIFEAADTVDYRPGRLSEEVFKRLVRENLTKAMSDG